MNLTWQALAREAGLAAEHIAIGVTALGRANYAKHAYYQQAFFALSIGFERSSKIALSVDHALDNGGAFQDGQTLRAYGHDLRQLLSLLEEIASKRKLPAPADQLPHSLIHDGVVDTLSDFAQNITRYYNLDLVAGDPRTSTRDDPISTWYRRVTVPVLEAHYQQRYRERHEQNARQIQALLQGHAIVRHHAETREPIDSPYEASLQMVKTEFAKRWERMYVLQVARFVASVLADLGYEAQTQQLPDVPYLGDFFTIFRMDDAYFRSRKTWSIYSP
ncbi:MAG: hypothetical protein ABSB96_05085 [Gaiellaceae bacterium]